MNSDKCKCLPFYRGVFRFLYEAQGHRIRSHVLASSQLQNDWAFSLLLLSFWNRQNCKIFISNLLLPHTLTTKKRAAITSILVGIRT